MSQKKIHIVCFDIPYPADYGGVIDIYDRAQALKADGWDVHLHCFEYRRPRSKQLEKVFSVNYYKRDLHWRHQLSFTPYIVKTRKNQELDSQLRNTEGLVLLEGLHCSSFLFHNCGYYLRVHNREHEYYRELAKKSSGWKSWYYRIEAWKLKRAERKLALAEGLLCISPEDAAGLQKIHSNTHVLPPVFKLENPRSSVPSTTVLYHGNLSVEENEEAANWILQNVVKHRSDLDFVFAGKDPSADLQNSVSNHGALMLANPTEEQMNEQMQKARVHILFSSQNTGLKLKMLRCLATSAHVLLNDAFVVDTALKPFLNMANTAEEYLQILDDLMKDEPKLETLHLRWTHLQNHYGEQVTCSLFEKLIPANS